MGNGGLRYFIFERPNFFNIGLLEFGPAMLLTHRCSVWACVFPILFRIRSAFFKIAIMLIIGMCSEKQMFRICARRIITFMANAKTFRNGTIMDFPRKPVCGIVFIKTSYATIAVMSWFSFPFPTFVGFNNLVPEVLYKWFMFYNYILYNGSNIVKQIV